MGIAQQVLMANSIQNMGERHETGCQQTFAFTHILMFITVGVGGGDPPKCKSQHICTSTPPLGSPVVLECSKHYTRFNQI